MATLPVKETSGTATARPRKNATTLARSSEDFFRIEYALAMMLIAVAAIYLRVLTPRFSTAYMDESIYVVYGRMFLSRHFEAPLDTPLQWSFGWYLWPAMAALADRVGGLVALRELAAGLGVVTVAATYGFATRVFNKMVGLGAAAVMAVLGPALLISKIATRDSGSICFFALGLWAYAAAWETNRKRNWALAALCFFAAFLCKYLVAVFFPVLVLLALRKGLRPILIFALPLFAFCAAYAALHAADLYHLLRYGSVYSSLKASPEEALNIYLSRRADFWILVFAALPLFLFREWRRRAAALWVGVLVILAVQLKTRADFDYWKHVNYVFLFLVPLAVAGVVFWVQELHKKNYHGQMIWGVGGVVALAAITGWLGQGQSVQRFTFWPKVSPILAYFENHLAANDRILVDDTVLRYYLSPPLHQPQIVDPMYFSRGGKSGDEAYKAAVREGEFNYVVLDGGIGGEARQMNAAIRPELSGYQLEFAAIEPTLGQTIQIYAKSGHAAPAAVGPGIRILSPASNAVVSTGAGGTFAAQGQTEGARAGWYVRVDVFTDQWHPQGEDIPISANGTFQQTINLGGQGRQQCYHIVRARLLDQNGNSRAVTMNYGIGRTDEQGSCREAHP
jgi:hypothetical protein